MQPSNQEIQSNIELIRLERNAKQASYKAKQRQKRLDLVTTTLQLYSKGIEVKQHHKKQTPPKVISSPIGFEAYTMKRSGEIVSLPPQFRAIFKACKQLVTNKYRFKALSSLHGYRVARADTRLNVARCLVVILARCEILNGRVGVLDYEHLTGINTISHHDLMEDYVLRFGKMIDDQTWYTSIKLIREAGYLNVEQIKTNVGSGVIRAAAAYKQFTKEFFKDLKVTYQTKIAEFIMKNYNDGRAKGLNYNWREYSNITQEIFDNYHDHGCNSLEPYPQSSQNITESLQH